MNESNLGKEMDKLVLKTIHELLGKQFYIPAYQRGYRWSKLQVRELLDDIWEFSQKVGDKASFYCLQPIVVLERNSKWEVVDGQQRLTTLYIILHYLEKKHLRRDLLEAYKKSIFSLEYQTRNESRDFLADIEQYKGKRNIDYHHIKNAYEEVIRWFEQLDYSDHNKFLATLLAKPDELHSVQVIWYDLSDECKDNEYAIDVFSRINIGKIPLTNSELVKALFLQSSNFQQDSASLKKIQIATEWDLIEKSLQEPSFWNFIYNPTSGTKYDTRIEYIFDLMKNKTFDAEAFFTFHQFNAEFKECTEGNRHKVIDTLWKKVKDYFLTFDEWYRDRELFHLIGFLVTCDQSVSAIKAESEKKNVTKTAFKEYLKSEIRKKVPYRLDDLSYGDKNVRKVLLLANIQTLLSTKEADIRFPFDRYKNENWDIEHIRSQTEKEITGKSRRDWLIDVLEYFTGVDDHTKINIDKCPNGTREIVDGLCKILKAEKIDDANFKVLYEKVASEFKEGTVDWIDSFGNLALLDSSTNRSYKNAMFPIKRKRIIHNDGRGVFVPICTKNAFLKYYSTSLGEVMYWQEADARDYLAAMKEVLKEYLPNQESVT